MAGDRIQGLSIGLDLDTLKLERGLTGLKDKLKTVNSEMKNNMSAFDRGDKSVEKYETRLNGLNKKLEVQKQVTKAAKEEYEKMVAEHQEGSVEAEKAERAYNNQAAALNNLERYIERTTDELKEFIEQQRIAESGWSKLGNVFKDTGTKLTNVGKSMKDTGKKLTKSITLPALGAASALAGIALVKGFDRLVGIDTARAKLTGLGHDAEGVEKIMESALDSVRGTSFGMDEAATTAANAVAAGVEEGKELTKYLTITGDAAAIAGASMGEMGSILNKVRTSNKAYNGELQQLSDRGLPIYQWLAKEAGVTADAITDMAADGEISSEMLMNAIENNIGGAAKKMGEESFTAGLANMWAAVGRLGASFLDAGGKGGGFFSQLKPLIADFTGRIDSMGDFAEKAGVKFGEFFTNVVDKVKAAKARYDELSPSIQDIIKKVTIFGSIAAVAMGPVLTFGGLFLGLVGNIMTVLSPLLTRIAKAGGLLKWLRLGFMALTGPIGITVGIIAALVTGFVTAYKKSSNFREMIHNLKDAFLNAVSGIKEFLTTNPQILAFVDGVKSAFKTMKDRVSEAIGAIVKFFKEKISDIKSFWDSNGKSFLEAWSNIFNGIWTVVKPVLDAIVAAVKWAMPIIKNIFDVTFKVILAVIKMVWENIKGVIDGGLKFIMGLVKAFSGLFTGDFDKMWEGVKDMFSGAIQFIWNFVQLTFFGKLLKGVTVFIKSFVGFISSMWTGIRNTFSTVIKWIVDFVKNSFTTMKTTVSDIFTGIKNIATTVWNGIKDGIINPVKDAATTAITRFRDFRDSVSTVFTKIKENVSGFVSDMVQNVKDMPGKMKDGIVQMAYKVYDGMKTVANKMASGLGKGVNGVITGVNWVTEKLGIKKKIALWEVPQYAQGTSSHPGGVAMVGDGKGSNAGSELIRTGNKYHLSPAKPTLVNLPKGAEVLPASLTKQLIPKYAWGTKLWEGTKDVAGNIRDATVSAGKAVGRGIKTGAGAVKDFGINVWDYAKNPGKLLNLALDTLGIKMPSGATTLGKIAKGGFTTVKNNAVGFIKKKIDEMLSFGGGPAPKGGSSAWRGMILKAAARMGESVTAAEVNGIIAQIQRESGGNQKIVQSSAVWDVNTAAGNPARGLLQYIPQTFNAYKVPGHGNIYSGYDQLLAFFNNRTWRRDLPYGTRGWGPRGGRRFASGGLINNAGLYNLAEGGFPEWVIPTDPSRRTDAMKLLALAGKDIQGNKRPNQLPNVNSGNDDGGLLQAVLEQNKILMALLQSNQNIEKKPVISENDIGRAKDRYDSNQTIKNNIYSGRVAY